MARIIRGACVGGSIAAGSCLVAGVPAAVIASSPAWLMGAVIGAVIGLGRPTQIIYVSERVGDIRTAQAYAEAMR